MADNETDAAKAEKDKKDAAAAAAAAAKKKEDDPDSELLQGARDPDAVKNALQRERDAAKEARKRADAAETRAKALEGKDKTEAEKAAEKAKEGAEAKLMRFEVAAAKGLDAKWAPRLAGSTKEELEADAEKLAKEITPARPGFDGGARQSVDDQGDPDAAIRRMAGRG